MEIKLSKNACLFALLIIMQMFVLIKKYVS